MLLSVAGSNVAEDVLVLMGLAVVELKVVGDALDNTIAGSDVGSNEGWKESWSVIGLDVV